MDVLKGVDLSRVRVARGGDKVFKDECVYSFHTPESEGGLYVSLTSLLGFSREFVELNYRKTGEQLYLLIKRTAKPKSSEVAEPPEKKPTKLAIGVEGGFAGEEEKIEYDEESSLVILPGFTSLQLPNDNIPLIVQESVVAIQSAVSAARQDAITAWEGDKRRVSKHAANLVQLDNGVKIPPSGWQCAMCDLTTNLWLNLTDGMILCGRRYFDGSGGNNHAVEHFDRNHYPLAVKLGTITPAGADVFSYDEDDMVEDPNLPQHLAHWGINIATMSKTDKTMTELEIDINMRIGEWSVLQESDKQLILVSGPGYTGLQNLGNSCYLNSVMQVLFAQPEFKSRYYDTSSKVFESCGADPTGDLTAQLSKLAVGLLSGRYCEPLSAAAPSAAGGGPPEGREQKGIRPTMLKTLIGQGHREFSSNRQQDAQEFFLHLLTLMEREQKRAPGPINLIDMFRYKVEECVRCVVSKKVRYSYKPELLLTLPVPMERATNKAEVETWEAKKQQLLVEKKKIDPKEAVRAKVLFSDCLAAYSLPADIPDFYSTAVQAKSPATRTYRFTSFPNYLMVQLAKFTVGKDWVPVKYDVEVNFPEELDLTHLRGRGQQEGEELLPEGDTPPQAQPTPVVIDEAAVMQLASMGFSVEGCKRAVYHTHNQGAEAAMNWVLEHMSDPDFNSPFEPPQASTPPSSSSSSSSSGPSEEDIMMIMSLGFTREHSIQALKATGGSVERAADWVFSHDEQMSGVEEAGGNGGATEQVYPDGHGKYQLVAFISHMGTSTMSGHYVCHIKKEGKWILFNDRKVAESVAPPKDLAYLYLYKRLPE